MTATIAILFDWGATLACAKNEQRAFTRCSDAAVSCLCCAGCALPPDASELLRSRFRKRRTASMTDQTLTEFKLNQVLSEWLDDMALHVDERELQDAEHAFWTAWTTCLDLLDNADEVMRCLSQRGYSIGLVSNVTAPQKYCETQLKRLGLYEYLDTITVSSALGVRKPHPDIYLDAMRKLRTFLKNDALQPQEVLFVGDSPLCDVEGPASMGMRTTLITHPQVNSPWPAEQYERVKPDHQIKRLSELLKLIPHT